jgi:predicted transcriptional regulator
VSWRPASKRHQGGEPRPPCLPKPQERDQAKEAQAKTRELAKRQQDLEKRIAELEKKKKELEDGFLDPELTKRPDKMRAMSVVLGKVKDVLEASFDKWQELEERKG